MNYTKVRREDRAIYDDAWIAEFLCQAPVIAVSFTDGNQPYVKPTLFIYDPERHAVYFHATQFGRTTELLRQHPKAAFTAFEMGRLLPAERAMDFSVEYESVVAFGEIAIIDDEDEATHGLQLLLNKYFPHLKPGEDYASIQSRELKITAVFRLDIQEWVGKRKRVDDDFPGAFSYNALPIRPTSA
ncbi:MAG TPA: pyridoxamine 5'-phosphate oxidase family protein [Anaerolineae bacterium]|nr:pyridoxamine 5'-phosphate oxidase family protein [Anaerolineae bacterium]